jgi:hypothetical protein
MSSGGRAVGEGDGVTLRAGVGVRLGTAVWFGGAVPVVPVVPVGAPIGVEKWTGTEVVLPGAPMGVEPMGVEKWAGTRVAGKKGGTAATGRNVAVMVAMGVAVRRAVGMGIPETYVGTYTVGVAVGGVDCAPVVPAKRARHSTAAAQAMAAALGRTATRRVVGWGTWGSFKGRFPRRRAAAGP